MDGYADLLKALQEAGKNIARFRRVVLHTHSPGSYDYSGQADEYPAGLLGLNLDVVAVTDHMKCAFACDLVKKATAAGRCVLPGMEVSIRPRPPWGKFRLHILVVFPESYSLERICKILPASLPDEQHRNGREEIEAMELPTFVEAVHNYGGLCIAAHVDNDRGVRKAFRQLGREGIALCDPEAAPTQDEEAHMSEAFRDWMLSAGFDAIEVRSAGDKEHYRWISQIQGRTVSVPVILANDSHSVEELGETEKVTHIKMTDLSFAGLEQALGFPDTRIRFPNELPTTPSPRLLGLEIRAGGKGGFFQDLRLAFSENLNCLIGPRGSGKSTIIEALRYAFGYNRTLGEIEDTGDGLAKKVRSLQQATLSNCVVRVVYSLESGENHILEATYDPKQDYATRVYTARGEDRHVADVEASGQYPLRLFGWSEIETLGREPHRQRELLDRLIPDLLLRLEQRKGLRAQLREKRGEIRSSVKRLEEIAGRNQGEIRRHREYKADFDRLNTKEARELFAGLDLARSQLTILEKVKTNASSWGKSLRKSETSDLFQGVGDLIGEDAHLLTWWNDLKTEKKLVGKQSDIKSLIRKAVEALEDLVKELDSHLDVIEKEVQEKDKAIRQGVSERAAQQVAVDLRRTAGERLQRVEQLRRDYGAEWQGLQDQLEEWKHMAGSLAALQDEISGKRSRRKEEIEIQLNRLSYKDMAVSLRFASGGDRREFEEHLRSGGLLNRDMHGNYKANRWPERIAAVVTPTEFASALLGKDPASLTREVKDREHGTLGIDEEMAKRLAETLHPFGTDEDAGIETVDGERLDRVLLAGEQEWDDAEGISLNDRPVERLSPGQRSSAMLPLIALSENAPLVIDQPEDNLDNRLVGQMLVDILADLKEKRQIIVATHNPNIVVLGDAEQVVVLDAVSDSEGRCSLSGSLDLPDIVKSVVDNMEGGREAFLTRRKRYALE